MRRIPYPLRRGLLRIAENESYIYFMCLGELIVLLHMALLGLSLKGPSRKIYENQGL